MYEWAVQAPRATRPRVVPGARPRAGRRGAINRAPSRAPVRSTVLGAVAAEQRPGYRAEAAGCAGDTDAVGAPAGGGPFGSGDAGDAGARTAGEHGRAALARLTAGGYAPLAAAVAGLAEAADALAAVDVTAEHVDDVADAALALCHLRTRVDAVQLAVLASFDRREGYTRDGAASAASWLRRRTNSDFGAATALVQTARRLAGLPELAANLASGDVTLAHVTAIAKAAVAGRAAAIADAEAILVELARSNPPRDVRRALRHLADAADPDGSDPADAPAAGADPLRELSLRAGFQGRGELLGVLDPLTREALATLLDAFDTPDPADTPCEQRRNAAQRRHDAFAAMLHTLLAQPGLPSVQGARPQVLITIDLAALLGLPADHPAAAITLADIARLLGIDLAALGLNPPDEEHTSADEAPDQDAAAGEDAPGAAAEAPGAAAADHDAAAADAPEAAAEAPGAAAEAPGAAADAPGAAAAPRTRRPAAPARTRPARYGSGVPVHPDLVRGLLPAATIMAVLTLGPWRAVNVGSKHRTLPAWLRTILTMIHQHCRGPDCDRPANWTQAHHITDWVLARTTDLNDTLPLCAFHHKLITNGGWTARLDHRTGDVIWTSPDGRIITVPPPRP